MALLGVELETLVSEPDALTTRPPPSFSMSDCCLIITSMKTQLRLTSNLFCRENGRIVQQITVLSFWPLCRERKNAAVFINILQTMFLSVRCLEEAFVRFPYLRKTLWKVVAIRLATPLYLDQFEYQVSLKLDLEILLVSFQSSPLS